MGVPCVHHNADEVWLDFSKPATYDSCANGTLTSFAFTLSRVPIIPGSIVAVVSGKTAVVRDDGSGSPAGP